MERLDSEEETQVSEDMEAGECRGEDMGTGEDRGSGDDMVAGGGREEAADASQKRNDAIEEEGDNGEEDKEGDSLGDKADALQPGAGGGKDKRKRTTEEDDNDDEEDDDDEEEGDVGDGGEEEGDVGDGEEEEKKKVVPPGIVYLGHIPPRLKPRHMRNMLSPYGEIGRIFLQPEDRSVKRKKRKVGVKGCSFTEGWVEFRDKRVAKRVAASLHNTPMGNRKRSQYHSDLWSIKYLHRFQWCHLSERLAYENMVLQQRLRTEISQAKRETNFYLANVEKSQGMDKRRKKAGQAPADDKTWDFTQRRTEEEIQLKKMKGLSKKNLQKAQDKAKAIQEQSQSNVSLLAKIFGGSKGQS